MTFKEAPYILPDGAHVWVQSTAEASKYLPDLLRLYRSGSTEPLVFGDAGYPEAAVVPFGIWRALVEAATDDDGFDTSYRLVRQHRIGPHPSPQFEEPTTERGWPHDDPNHPDPY